MNDPQVLIAEYRSAFVAANHKAAPIMEYSGGWFTLKSNAFIDGVRYRRKAIERMRDRLLERAAS